jgi:hypothetical protein
MKIVIGNLTLSLDAGHIALGALCLALLLVLVGVLIMDIMALRRRGVVAEAPAMPAPGGTTQGAPFRSQKSSTIVVEKAIEEAAPAGEEGPLREASGADAALVLLGLFQKEARFVDFLHEDIAHYSDEEVGAAARLVHDGCIKALKAHITLEPIRKEEEESEISVPAGFNAAAIRLIGNVVGKPPFQGRLVHRGWRAVAIKLPRLAKGHDPRILAAAEVEL